MFVINAKTIKQTIKVLLWSALVWPKFYFSRTAYSYRINVSVLYSVSSIRLVGFHQEPNWHLWIDRVGFGDKNNCNMMDKGWRNTYCHQNSIILMNCCWHVYNMNVWGACAWLSHAPIVGMSASFTLWSRALFFSDLFAQMFALFQLKVPVKLCWVILDAV